jgi:hypothetical protein
MANLPTLPADISIAVGQLAGRVEGLVYALRALATAEAALRLLDSLESEALHAKALAAQVGALSSTLGPRARDESDAGRRLKAMRRSARSFAFALTKTRRMTEDSQQHEDRMLTWLLGLMGAGLFALPSLLAACSSSVPSRMLWTAWPWAAGVLIALVGRVIGGMHRDADRMAFGAKWGGIQALLVKSSVTPEGFGSELLALMNDDHDRPKHYKRKTEVLRWWTERFYYASVAAFGVGVAVVLWRLASC